MKCANVAFSVVPRISARDAENCNKCLSSIWSSGLAYVWHCMLLFFFLFVLFFTLIYLQHIAQLVESDRPLNIVFVHPSIHPFFLVSL